MADTDIYRWHRDDCADLCAVCAGQRLGHHVTEELHHDRAGARRLAAAYRLATLHAAGNDVRPDDVRRILSDDPALLADACNRAPYILPPADAAGYAAWLERIDRVASKAARTNAARCLLDGTVHNLWSWETSDTRWGTYCEDCSDLLEPAWVECRRCGTDDAADRFPYADGVTPTDGDWRREPDGPMVDRCERCSGGAVFVIPRGARRRPDWSAGSPAEVAEDFAYAVRRALIGVGR